MDKPNNNNLYIRKSENSNDWECGYMLNIKKSGELTWVRELICKKPSYEEAEQWLNEQGKLNVP